MNKTILPYNYFCKDVIDEPKGMIPSLTTDYSLFPGQFHQFFLVSIAYRQLHASDHYRGFSYGCNKIHCSNI